MFSLMMITVLVGMGHFWIVFLFSDWGSYVKEIQWIKIREEFSTNIFNRDCESTDCARSKIGTHANVLSSLIDAEKKAL